MCLDAFLTIIYCLIIGIFPPLICMRLHVCRYSVIMKAMLYQVEEFNNKQGSASGMQAAAMAELTERQTPQLSASEPFDLDMPLIL